VLAPKFPGPFDGLNTAARHHHPDRLCPALPVKFHGQKDNKMFTQQPEQAEPVSNTHNKYALSKEIISRSVANTWDQAKLEWEWVGWFKETNPYGTCLCGHSPITDHCVLMNRKNSERVIVGSVCVKKFLGLPADKIFHAIERIQEDPARSLNAETIDFAYEQGWITFLDSVSYGLLRGRKKLAAEHLQKRIEINGKVLSAFQASLT